MGWLGTKVMAWLIHHAYYTRKSSVTRDLEIWRKDQLEFTRLRSVSTGHSTSLYWYTDQVLFGLRVATDKTMDNQVFGIVATRHWSSSYRNVWAAHWSRDYSTSVLLATSFGMDWSAGIFHPKLIDDPLYSAILRSLEQTHCARLWFYMSDKLFNSVFFEYPPKWCTYSTGMAGATWNCSHLGTSSVYTIQPCTMSLHAKPHT